MLIARRLSQVLITFSVTMMVYSIYVGLTLRQICRMLRIDTMSPAAPGPKRVPDGCIELFGIVFTWWQLFALFSLIPASWCIAAFYDRIQQAYRAKHDLCAHCGHALSSWHGRCPACGERIGPEVRHVHTLRG